jgi:hypothetical protein
MLKIRVAHRWLRRTPTTCRRAAIDKVLGYHSKECRLIRIGQTIRETNSFAVLEAVGENARQQVIFRLRRMTRRQGATELLTVLQAQQTLFAAEDQLAQTKLAHMQAVIHLYEALGGGWIESPEERTQFAARQSAR